MNLLPETKLLIGEYGNANFDFGELDDSDIEVIGKASKRMVAAKEALTAHLEAHYIPKP